MGLRNFGNKNDASFGKGRDKSRILYAAVVVNFISNPIVDLKKVPANDEELTYAQSLLRGANKVSNADLIMKMPRSSIIANVISDRDGWKSLPEIFYPFFPHMSFPVKPGEQVWVIYDTDKRSKSRRGYWMTRIASDLQVDDLNYTHLNREILYLNKSSADTSPMEAHEGAALFTEDIAYSYPLGGGSTVTNNTLPGDNPFGNIIASSPSYVDQFIGEPVPRFSKRVGDFILQGSHNTLISMGADRSGDTDTRPGIGDLAGITGDTDILKGYGTIDIVTGRGQTDTTCPVYPEGSTNDVYLGEGVVENDREYEEIDKMAESFGRSSNPNEGDTDFIYDLSRLYISMKTSGDANFGLSFTYLDNVDESPYIIAKSNEIRLIGRGSVRAMSEAGAELTLMSTGEGALIGSRVFLGAASYDHVDWGSPDMESGHEHVIKGDTLLVAFESFLEEYKTLEATIITYNGSPIPGLNWDIGFGTLLSLFETLVGDIRESLSDIVHTA